MFRGEFVNLNGGADFYATNVEDLHKEGKISLDAFWICAKKMVLVQKRIFLESLMSE